MGDDRLAKLLLYGTMAALAPGGVLSHAVAQGKFGTAAKPRQRFNVGLVWPGRHWSLSLYTQFSDAPPPLVRELSPSTFTWVRLVLPPSGFAGWFPTPPQPF